MTNPMPAIYDFSRARASIERDGLAWCPDAVQRVTPMFRLMELSEWWANELVIAHAGEMKIAFGARRYPWFARVAIALHFLGLRDLFKKAKNGK